MSRLEEIRRRAEAADYASGHDCDEFARDDAYGPCIHRENERDPGDVCRYAEACAKALFNYGSRKYVAQRASARDVPYLLDLVDRVALIMEDNEHLDKRISLWLREVGHE